MLLQLFLARFLRIFFQLLYHSFAWTYDLVAWTVSLGRWKVWVKSVIPYIEGTHFLELGHGPGHLQRTLLDLGFLPFGLDESRQMGLLAKKRLVIYDYTQGRLVRSLGQNIPFASNTFDTIFATFPAEYIFTQQTLLEVRRALKIGGKLIVLPVAWVTGKGMLDRFASWLFRFTRPATSSLSQQVIISLTEPFNNSGFLVETKLLEVKSSCVLIIFATKSNLK